MSDLSHARDRAVKGPPSKRSAFAPKGDLPHAAGPDTGGARIVHLSARAIILLL